MRSHPSYKALHTALGKALPGVAVFRGILYRACDPVYANTRDLLTGVGNQKHGGRWNAPDGMATIYLSQSIEGAISESLGLPSRFGFDPATRLPLTLVAVDASIELVIDFTDTDLRKKITITFAAMTGCDWRSENVAGREALTQALGRAAFELGAHGIIVPSAAKRTYKNLTYFPPI
jgi:RES domain-containing protein